MWLQGPKGQDVNSSLETSLPRFLGHTPSLSGLWPTEATCLTAGFQGQMCAPSLDRAWRWKPRVPL